jgi:hypothetical protein
MRRHEEQGMAARIFQRSKNAMQSGQARAGDWILQYESHRPHTPDPLMGWSGGGDTQSQVTIGFPTLDAAKAYAERHGIPYHVIPAPPASKLRLQSYADNFR